MFWQTFWCNFHGCLPMEVRIIGFLLFVKATLVLSVLQSPLQPYLPGELSLSSLTTVSTTVSNTVNTTPLVDRPSLCYHRNQLSQWRYDSTTAHTTVSTTVKSASPVDGTRLCYQRHQLLQWRISSAPAPDVCSQLRILGLHALPSELLCVNRPKKRRVRGGRRKKGHSIPVIITSRPTLSPTVKDCAQKAAFASRSSCQCNLINIVPSVSDAPETPHMSLAYFNAQSARGKTVEISDFVVDNDLDVLLLTEAWFRPSGDEPLLAEIKPAGYALRTFPRCGRDGGGIVAMFKTSLENAVTFKQLSFKSFEAVEMNFRLETPTQMIIVYRPSPSSKNKLTLSMFWDEFPELLDSAVCQKHDFVAVGDFNFHLDDAKDSNAKHFRRLLADHGLVQHIQGPTQRAGHTLDLLITREGSSLVNGINLHDTLLSDHTTIFFRMNMSRPRRSKRMVTSRNLRRIDPAKFGADVRSACEVLQDESSNDQLLDAYNSAMLRVMDQHAPLTTRLVTARRTAPWLSDDLKDAKRELRRAEQQWRSSGLTVHRQIFVSKRSALKLAQRAAKKEYYTSMLADCRSSRQLFSVTNQLLGKTSEPTLPNNIPTSALPDELNSFFESKISAIRAELDLHPSSVTHAQYEGPKISAFTPVTEEFVKKLILCSPSKSCSLDPMPTTLAKSHIDNLLPVITRIINASLLSGSVPQQFRQAIVTPLIKKPGLDQNVLKNYRPVSNLPFLSKVLEKIVQSQVLQHLTDNDLLETYQSAYRKHHSTETALLHVTNNLLTNTDTGNISLLSLLDLSAAFDTLDHKILVDRLQYSFGITDSALQWFVSYLENRFQQVVVRGSSSKPLLLKYGVPQGSVLGPLLFSLYTKPLSTVIHKTKTQYHKYADDTQLLTTGVPSMFDTMISDMEDCVKDVKDWMTCNKLKLNDDKTECMVIGTRQRVSVSSDEHITIGGTEISFKSEVKNLGVFLDSQLTMEKQINNLCRSAYLELRRIGMIRHLLSEKTTAQLVCSRVLSRLDYCNSLLAGISSTQLLRLQRIQNNAARLVLKKKRSDHATPLLKSLHWLPIKQRIEYKMATLAYRHFDKTLPPYLSDTLVVKIQNRNLRSTSANSLVIPRINLKTAGERSFRCQAPRVWNLLPSEIRQSCSLSSFKRKIKFHFFTKAFSQ